MWKDFFYFPKSERRGIIILVVLIMIINLGCWLYSFLASGNEISPSTQRIQEYEQFIASMMKYDSLKSEKVVSKEIITKRLFKFDPNTADSTQFVVLGLNRFVINNILKYRQKGGKFKKAEDFKKVYGLTVEEYEELVRWIVIPSIQPSVEENTAVVSVIDFPEIVSNELYERPFKYTVGTTLNLNLSDTTELKKIPGIGSSIANGIVAYRKRLGGFHKVEQLQDLSYVADTLNKWFFIDDSLSLTRINLNKASIERLTAHPYLNFYQSKVIVEYRKKKGKLNNLGQLSLYEEFTKEDMDRLSPYLFFD